MAQQGLVLGPKNGLVDGAGLVLPKRKPRGAAEPQDWYERAKAGLHAVHEPVAIGAEAGDAWYEAAKPKTFGDAFSEVGLEQVPFVGMFVEGGRALDLWSAAKRAEAGADLTEDEKKVLSDFFAEKDRDATWGYQVGKILTQLPAYGLEFWAGGTVARAGARGGLALAGKAVREAVESASARMAENALTRALGRSAAVVAESAGVTAAMPGRVLGEGVRRALADTFQVQEDDAGEMYLGLEGSLPDFANAVGEGAISMWVENLSEYTGGAISKLPGVQQASLLQMALIRKLVPPGKRLDVIRKIATGTHWDGLISEWGEERVADALHTLVQGDPYSWPDIEQATAELVAFLVPGVAAAGLGATTRLGRTRRKPGEPGTGVPAGLVSPPTQAEPSTEGVPAPQAQAEAGVPGTEIPSAVVGQEPAETAGPAQPRRSPPRTPEEAVRGLLAANVRAGAITQEEADASTIVEAPTPEAARMAEESRARGQNPVFVLAPRDLPLEAAYGERIIALDARAPLRKQVSGVFYEEWLHALRDQRRSTWNELERDLEDAVPGLLGLWRERYKEMAVARNVPVTDDVLADEAVANIAEDLAGYLDFVFRDPRRAVRLASGNPGLWRRAVDTFIEAVNRVFGTKLPTFLRRDLEELKAAVARTPLEAEIDPKLAIRLSLRIREALDSLLGQGIQESATAGVPAGRQEGEEPPAGPSAQLVEPAPTGPAPKGVGAPPQVIEGEPLSAVTVSDEEIPLPRPGFVASGAFLPEGERRKGTAQRELVSLARAHGRVWMFEPVSDDMLRVVDALERKGTAKVTRAEVGGIFAIEIEPPAGARPSPQKPVEEGGEPRITVKTARIIPTRGGVIAIPIEEEEPKRGFQALPETEEASARRLGMTVEQYRKAAEPAAGQKELAVRLLADRIEAGEDVSTMPKVVRILAAGGYPTRRSKELDELVEQALVINAMRIVARGLPAEETFDALQKLYQAQPKLDERTSGSRMRQAFSTPAPLAYVASRLARVKKTAIADEVFEPTAGHGMLLLQASPMRVTANEIDPARAKFLREEVMPEGRVTEQDALTLKPGKKFDVVLANPPFGKVQDEGGEARHFDVGRFHTTQIDHAIALRALESMKDNGRAVLILGSKKPFGNKNIEARRADLYNTQESRAFFKDLFDHYNVVAHFTVAGELYNRQGAAWPIDVLLIQGRGKSELPLPGVQAPPIYNTYDELREVARLGTEGLRPRDRGGVSDGEREAGRPGDLEGGARGEGGVAREEGAAARAEAAAGLPAAEPGAPEGAAVRVGRAPPETRPDRGRGERAVAGRREPAAGGGEPGGALGDREREPGVLADEGAAASGADLNAIFEEEVETAFQPEEPKPTTKPTSLEDELREGFNQLFSIEAFHGTPHEFEKFSTKEVGGGQGAQTFGWGLYFAGKREVAEFYRQRLSSGYHPRVFAPDGTEVSWIDALRAYFKPGRIVQSWAGTDRVMEFFAFGTLPGSWSVRVQSVVKSGNEWVNKNDPVRLHSTFPDEERVETVLGAEGYTFRKGNLYRVRLVPAHDEWLDWDKPLSKQSEKVRDALKARGFDVLSPTAIRNYFVDPRGGEIYSALEDRGDVMAASGRGAKGVSQFLLSLGIRGIRYLDQGSRKAGEGSYNYVVFDDRDIENVERFSIERPPGFDEETYARAVPFFEKALEVLKVDRKDARGVIRALIEYARDTLKLAKEKIARMRDYVVVFAREVAAGAKRQAEAPTVDVPERPAGQADLVQPQNVFQRAYRKRSRANSVDTLVPTNMQTAIDDALEAVAKRVGDTDDFVANHIGIPVGKLVGTPEKDGMLSAEQMDALALAIDNVERGAGFIIGDQTGVGKGRFVAGMIEYARKKGWAPVFVTQAPGLYGDIHRDLYALGQDRFVPLVTNVNLTGKKVIPLPARPGTNDIEGVRKLKSLPKGKLEEALQSIIRTGQLPEGVHALFTTYEQIDLLGGKQATRHKALRAIAPNALFILDESHNAGGSESRTFTKNGEKVPTRADFVRNLLKPAKGVVYSSATFAKNPYVMTLYFRTEMALAVDNLEQLVESIKAGGVPLQQVVSAMLAKSGQYVRREKNMDGIEMPGVIVKTNLELADDLSRLTREIFEFDMAFGKEIRKKFGESLRKQGSALAMDTAVGEVGVSSTSFASLLHNVTRQSLLALKSQAAIDEAVLAHKAGKKVLIGLADTFGAMLDDYVKETGIRMGEALADFNFNRVFLRYLERTRRVTITDAYGNKGHHKISDKDLAEMGMPHVVDAYEHLKAAIKQANLADLPSSPIDFIAHGLKKAGIRVGEITGRNAILEYGAGPSPMLRTRDSSDATKKVTIQRFNSGEIDALILNQSGATGYSMHAGKDFSDQRPRHMGILQAEANIDTFMQLLGRVNRTGQVRLPTYALLIADIPAEKRPAASLLRKMASLNANVSAKREGSFTIEGGVDFMNTVGDQVVASLLREDHGLADLLDVDPNAEDISGIASKATGRSVILTVEEQTTFLDRIEASYRSRLEGLEAMGESPLEAKVLDLEARVLRAQAVTPERGGDSPFAAPAVMEELDVKRLDKPVTWERLWEILGEIHGKEFTEADRHSREGIAARSNEALVGPIMKEFTDFSAKQSDRIRELAQEAREQRDPEKRDRAEKDVTRARSRHETVAAGANSLADLLGNIAYPGAAVQVSVGSGEEVQRVYGVVAKVERHGRTKSALSGSDYEITVYTTESKKPLSIIALHATEGGAAITPSTLSAVRAAFEEGMARAREKRFMLTGNLLSGFARFGRGGRIVIFTDEGGRTREGIMMSRSFDPAAAAENLPANIPVEKVANFLDAVGPSGEPAVQTDDEALQILVEDGGYVLRAATRGGRPYYLSPKVVRLIGDFTQRRGEPFWTATVKDHQTLRKVVRVYRETLGSNFQALFRKDLARQMTGVPELRFSIEPDPQALERIRKLYRRALKQGEGTELGREPSDTAVQSAAAEVRAYHRAVREERAAAQEVISREEQRRHAERELARDPVGVRRTILLKVDADEPLSAWETQAADILKEQATIAALQDENPAAYVDAVRLNWAYQDARRETARALGVIRDPLRAAARTGRQMLADLVAIPSADVREKVEKLKKQKRAPGLAEDARARLEKQIHDLLMQEGARVADAKKKLIKAGFDPKLLTSDYFKDPITYGRIARAVHDAKNPAGFWDWYLEWRLASMLSGPLTQVANITGNFAHMLYDQHVRKIAEALANSVVRDRNSATWGEVAAFYRAFLPALGQASRYLMGAYRTELPVFELDMQMRGVPGAGGRTKVELRGPAIPGPIGRIARAPSLTTLLAFDEFFKGLVATMEASALAYRQARSEGKAGDELTLRMRQILEDPGSEIQTQSLLRARRATFQADDSAFTRLVLNFRHFLNDTIGKNFLAGFPLGHVILPFVRTPIAIFKVGLFAANPFYALAIPYRFFRGRYRHGNQAALVRDAAQAAINLGVAMAILHLSTSTSGDDDDALPLITGTPAKGGGARDLELRTVPAYSIRIGGAWYSYRRIEPMAVTMATLVDLARDFIRASDEGTQEAAAAAAGRFFSSIAEQASDKTFLQTLGDIYQAVTERSEGTAVRILRDTLVLPMVPNIIRQPARNLDPEFRANLVRTYEDKGIWDAAARSLPYYALPLQQNAPPARYDLWGRPAVRADAMSGTLARLFSPAPRSASPERILDVDRMILRFNQRVERGEFGPDVEPFVQRPPAYWYEEKGVTRYWNDEEYARLTREAGEEALQRLERRRLNTENPTPKDIETVTEALAAARKRARDRMKRERRSRERSVQR